VCVCVCVSVRARAQLLAAYVRYVSALVMPWVLPYHAIS